jgi:hypothetical protein
MSASIFISYAGADQQAASRLCAALEARGFPCWIASRDVGPGESFQVAIVRAIRAARLMALVFTEAANHSDEIAKELALASQARLPVVPLRMQEIHPNEAFAYEFATRQWIDFTADWNAGLEQLVRRIALAVEPAPDPPTPRAPPRRRPLWPWLVLVVAAALAAGAFYLTPSLLGPAPPPHAAPPPAAAKPPPGPGNEIPF